jgi:thioredoxin reductase
MNHRQIDVAVIGGGPAGLSAAITLGRALRRVAVFDDGEPRNAASNGVHCFLGSEGVSPWELRDGGRSDAVRYGVEFFDSTATFIGQKHHSGLTFQVHGPDVAVEARAVLLAIGVRDELPDIPGLSSCYGKTVHHCPYCDGWEHREQRLVAIGNECVELGATLRAWSQDTTVCANGADLSSGDRDLLEKAGIALRNEQIDQITEAAGMIKQVCFKEGTPLDCDALFFSGTQHSRSALVSMLGCAHDTWGRCVAGDDYQTSVEGVYVAGDANGGVQFAIAAAAEGAMAAVAIDKWLRKGELDRR